VAGILVEAVFGFGKGQSLTKSPPHSKSLRSLGDGVVVLAYSSLLFGLEQSKDRVMMVRMIRLGGSGMLTQAIKRSASKAEGRQRPPRAAVLVSYTPSATPTHYDQVP